MTEEGTGSLPVAVTKSMIQCSFHRPGRRIARVNRSLYFRYGI